MDNQEVYDIHIIKYLSKDANPEETAFIEDWINAHENNRIYFEAVRKAWLLTGVAKTESELDEEWNLLRQRIVNHGLVVSMKETEARPGIFRILVAAAAASVIFFVGYWWLNSGRETDVQPQVVKSGQRNGERAINEQLHINHTAEPMQLVMDDGSEVLLSPNSELRYDMPESALYRHVYLTGKAFFKVAKNKEKPFTVFSRNIATTALGTQFTVTCYQHDALTRVMLHEGKVVVKAYAKSIGEFKREVFLKPNQELVFDNQTMTANVKDHSLSKNTTGSIRPQKGAKDNKSWYMFNHQPLSQVFEQLEDMYRVDIVYNKVDVQKLYFIGTFNKDDSVHQILNQICLLNDLKLTKENNKFIIKK